jgi:hypothetical protein
MFAPHARTRQALAVALLGSFLALAPTAADAAIPGDGSRAVAPASAALAPTAPAPIASAALYVVATERAISRRAVVPAAGAVVALSGRVVADGVCEVTGLEARAIQHAEHRTAAWCRERWQTLTSGTTRATTTPVVRDEQERPGAARDHRASDVRHHARHRRSRS